MFTICTILTSVCSRNLFCDIFVIVKYIKVHGVLKYIYFFIILLYDLNFHFSDLDLHFYYVNMLLTAFWLQLHDIETQSILSKTLYFSKQQHIKQLQKGSIVAIYKDVKRNEKRRGLKSH